MQLLSKVFSNSKVVLPVIHVNDLDQALRNTETARISGCDGCFLINHEMGYGKLLEIFSAVHRELSGWWIGVNCLGVNPVEVFAKIPKKVSGVWVDNAMIDETAINQLVADKIQEMRKKSRWQGLYFGGVAFKYQRPVNEWGRTARIATKYVDVVTTSGSATGRPAYVGKIKEMKQAIGNHPLAIASGITPQNVDAYLGSVDCFLVATGISTDFWNLDTFLVKELVRKVRNYQL